MSPYSPLLSNQFMLLIPILSLFQAFQLKTSPFFRHNKVADIYVRRKHTKGNRMNTQHKVSGEVRRKRLMPESRRRTAWLSGLTLALALGVAGTYQFQQQTRTAAVRTERRTSRLSELERKAKPYLKQAQDAVPAVASDLATFRSMSRFCRLLAQDKLFGTQTAQEFLAEKLRPVTSPCRRIAGLYGATSLPGLLQRDIRDIAKGHAYASLCAAGGLGLELVFLKTTLRSLAGVTASLSARLAASCGIGTAAALADGPVPFGDAVGVVLAAGGTAWCLIDLKQICAQLPMELTAALHQDILEFHEACRRSVLP